MNRIFELDFKKLARFLLPTVLRKGAVLALLDALLSPLHTLYERFISSRHEHLYALQITPQVCYLEKLLNDRYDTVLRRIYILDFWHIEAVYIFLEAEGKPLYISDDVSVYLPTVKEITDTQEADFVVNIPNVLIYNEKEMFALIDTYKLASKRYVIVRVADSDRLMQNGYLAGHNYLYKDIYLKL
jgi:hypothetical protein